MHPFVSRAEFARFRNVSRAAVTQWAAAGRLVLTPDGKVDVAASVKRLADTGGSSRGGKNGGGAAASAFAQSTTQATNGTQGPLGAGQETITLARVRTAREGYLAKLADLDYRERVGEIVDRSRVERGVADCLAASLAIIEQASARLAPRLIGQADIRALREIVDEELDLIRRAIADAADALVDASRGSRQ